MAIINGTIILSDKENITDMMYNADKTVANNFRAVSGYTATPDGSQMFAMLKSPRVGGGSTQYQNARLVDVSYSTPNISSNKTNLDHANDCTFYDNKYFVVTCKEDKDIYVFDNDSLNRIGIYKYDGTFLTALTSITHVSGSCFLLGHANKIAVCELSGTTFKHKSSFTLDGDDGNGEIGKLGLTRQGMFYGTTGYLFKVYSKVNSDDSVRKNYIAKWSLTGSAPNFTASTLKGLYKHEVSSDIFLFELEDVSATGNQMYVAVRNQDERKSPNYTPQYEALLYHITLEDS